MAEINLRKYYFIRHNGQSASRSSTKMDPNKIASSEISRELTRAHFFYSGKMAKCMTMAFFCHLVIFMSQFYHIILCQSKKVLMLSTCQQWNRWISEFLFSCTVIYILYYMHYVIHFQVIFGLISFLMYILMSVRLWNFKDGGS